MMAYYTLWHDGIVAYGDTPTRTIFSADFLDNGEGAKKTPSDACVYMEGSR